MIEVRNLPAEEARKHLPELARVLLDCVRGGASVGFLDSLSTPDAQTFFAAAITEVEAGRRILLAAFSRESLVGTVQILPATMPNQAHRADIAKLLVLRSARGQGIATQLMSAAENASCAVGRTLLVLDTVTGSAAERLYTRLGWTRVGVIPRYAVFPDGSWCDTTVFYKQL